VSALRPVLLGVPWDENSSYLMGAAGAPPLIREALWCESSNAWGENGVELTRETLADAGDVGAATGAAMVAAIEKAVGDLLDRGLAPICLGGDHAITYPVLRAFARRYARLSILHFDAHPDLYDVFAGNRLSHACPFARIMEEGLAGRLVQVGLRTISRHQREQAARFGVEMVEMRSFRDDFTPSFETPIYVTFDLDGLDPSCAPGVSHPEPGGLTTRQAVDLIYRLKAPIIGADVVELNPTRDVSGMTAMVAGKLVKEIAARMREDSPTPPATPPGVAARRV
jgi:agmatinase